MLLLACLFLVVNAALTAKNALYVLSTFTSSSGVATCDSANFLETAYEFAQVFVFVFVLFLFLFLFVF